MGDVFRQPSFELDRSVPVLLVKVGNYPLHAGGLGVIRSLGLLGVPVYAITEDHFTPAVFSRHVAGHVVWSGSERVDPGRLVENLRSIGRWLGRPAVPVATDDEAAVLLAEHADELADQFLLPTVPPGVPRRLANKRELFALCRAHDVPTPHTVFPTGADDLVALGRELTFPLVAKNVAPWTRLRAPVVSGTTVVSSERELRTRFPAHADLTGVLLQEYIPHEDAEDWFVHSYCDAGSAAVVSFVGRKAYAWPPGRGVTADARAAPNPMLAELTARFHKAIGYQGVSDLDWRYDRRAGRFKLVDFNPRVGAQFRFGQSGCGVDVVRALHLSLTGRPVPAGDQDYSRRLVVENIYRPARVVHRLSRLPAAPPVPRGMRTHRAWGEGGGRDPLPLLVMAVRLLAPATVALCRLLLRAAGTAVQRAGKRKHPAGRPPAPVLLSK